MISIKQIIHNKIYALALKTNVYTRKNQKLEEGFRLRLKNDDFTIICPNCIGGIIYHRLGKQFLSPTINMWMSHKDFVKFVSNIKYYVSLDVDFIESNEKTPVAMLGDIKLHFNHSKTEEAAFNDWNRRKDRINYENMYIIAYDVAELDAEDISVIQSVDCKGVAILTNKKDRDNEIFLKSRKNNQDDSLFLGKDIFGIRTFEKQWAFVSFLNQ